MFIPIDLNPHAQSTFEVREETPTLRQVNVASDVGRRLLLAAMQRPDLASKTATQLGDIRTALERLTAIDEQVASLDAQKTIYSEREDEVRSNLRALGKSGGNADLRQTLQTSMAEPEKNLDGLSRILSESNFHSPTAPTPLALATRLMNVKFSAE